MSPPDPPPPPALPLFVRSGTILVLGGAWAAAAVSDLVLAHPNGVLRAALATGSLGVAWWVTHRAERAHAAMIERERDSRERAAQFALRAEEREAQARAQARELAQTRDDALRAVQAKDAFLATMSHELRTPLNAVIGLSGLLADTPLNEQQKEYIDIISSSSRTLLELIGDILDVSKLEAGRLEPEARAFDLIACVEDALDLVATQAHAKGLELVADIDPSVPRSIVSDVSRLRQILANLLSNAVKFTYAGEIVARVTASPQEGRRTEIRFDVRDTGIGIPADRLDRLFVPFSQVDSSTTREFGGTGLGLVISRSLAGLLGGSMWVESVAGRGTVFSFTILAEADPPPPPPPVVKRVLVVDDSASARQALVRMLLGLGAAAVEASSAQEALDALKRDPFDLALVDLSVPGTGEASLSSQLQRSVPALPVVMLAPRSVEQRSLLGQLGDGVAYLAKPVRSAALLALLSAASASPPDAREISQLSALATLQILIVEDNPINRKVLLKMLEKLGQRADAVASGAEALAAVQRQRYRVILLDVNMPGMDGYEVASRLCDRYPRPRRPRIIGVTANALPGDREKCLASGMDDYLSKPIELESLARALAGPAHNPISSVSWSISSSLLDPNVLQQVRASTGGEVLDRHAPLLTSLAAALDQKDYPAVQAHAGALLRLARTIGAVQLSAILIGFDILVAHRRYEELNDLALRARSLAERTAQVVARLLQGAPVRA
jgi:signal transduction histidine kinase/CheY-like chemotaxis protein